MFVCFEGIDGAGKTTQARMLLERLIQEQVPVELVSDPGTTKIGTAIRQILLHNDDPISPAAQMLLFSAARAELACHIEDQLRAGVVVICDRWLLSTLVYQGEINNISIDLITHIFQETSPVRPDICFLLDIDPAVSRLRRPSGPSDRYERRCIEDHNRMRAAYKTHAERRAHTGVVHQIHADCVVEETHETVYRLFSEARSSMSVISQLT